MSADLASAAVEGFGVLLRGMTAPRTEVYPGYIGMCIKRALRAADTEQIITDIGEMRTVGDCRYATTVTDFNGTEYEVTVRVRAGNEAAE